MPLQISAERLYDFEATLRLVDNALDELQVLAIDLTGQEKSQGGDTANAVAAITPLRVYREVQEGLHSLRQGRRVLESTYEASRSEGPVSTGDALSSLDRALTLVAAFESSGPNRANVFQLVGEEIRSAMECLRTRGVTEQQLSYAAFVLLDMDNRLVQLSDLLDPYGGGSAAER